VAAVYQRQLSVPSLQGRLMSTSERWGVNEHTTRRTSAVPVVLQLRLMFGTYLRYLITPSVNANSRTAELSNIEDWASYNNMKLNRSKSVEIIVTRQRRNSNVSLLPTLHDIARVQTIKILGVTISDRLSVNQHVTNVIASYAFHAYEYSEVMD